MPQAITTIFGIPDSITTDANSVARVEFGSLFVVITATACKMLPIPPGLPLKIDAELENGLWTATQVQVVQKAAPTDQSQNSSNGALAGQASTTNDSKIDSIQPRAPAVQSRATTPPSRPEGQSAKPANPFSSLSSRRPASPAGQTMAAAKPPAAAPSKVTALKPPTPYRLPDTEREQGFIEQTKPIQTRPKFDAYTDLDDIPF